MNRTPAGLGTMKIGPAPLRVYRQGWPRGGVRALRVLERPVPAGSSCLPESSLGGVIPHLEESRRPKAGASRGQLGQPRKAVWPQEGSGSPGKASARMKGSGKNPSSKGWRSSTGTGYLRRLLPVRTRVPGVRVRWTPPPPLPLYGSTRPGDQRPTLTRRYHRLC